MKVVVIDNSSDIVEVVSTCFGLRWSDTSIVSADTGAEGLELIEAENPDIVILDINLPDIDGFKALEDIRRFSQVPLIILTERGKDTDIVKGFELGADDYIVKPFSQVELIARVQNALRHTRELPIKEHSFVASKLEINFAKSEVKVEGKSVRLSPIEYRLLWYLISNEGKMITYKKLLRKVWGGTKIRARRDLLRAHINRLRKKLGDNLESPKIIVTEHGWGYKFARPM